jgi:hypothetical protein
VVVSPAIPEASKSFRYLVGYLKLGAAMLIAMSIVGIGLIEVAPFLTLEQLIFIDWYGRPTLPAEAVMPFRLAMLLFSWLSVLSGILLYYIVRYGIERRERWAYHAYLWLGVAWPLGAAVIAIYSTAYWYLLSAGFMTLLFTPPVFLLGRYMNEA